MVNSSNLLVALHLTSTICWCISCVWKPQTGHSILKVMSADCLKVVIILNLPCIFLLILVNYQLRSYWLLLSRHADSFSAFRPWRFSGPFLQSYSPAINHPVFISAKGYSFQRHSPLHLSFLNLQGYPVVSCQATESSLSVILQNEGKKTFYILVSREVCKIRNEIKFHFNYECAYLL